MSESDQTEKHIIADTIFTCFFLNCKYFALIKISVKCVPIGLRKKNASEILSEIHTVSFTFKKIQNVVCEMAIILSRPQCVNSWEVMRRIPSSISHNAPFRTEMCTFSSEWGIVGYGTCAMQDLWNWTNQSKKKKREYISWCRLR